MHPERLDRLVVDTTSRSQKLSITIDITFPHMPCPLLALQTMDVAGTSQLDVEHNLIKYDIHPDIAESKAAFVYVLFFSFFLSFHIHMYYYNLTQIYIFVCLFSDIRSVRMYLFRNSI